MRTRKQKTAAGMQARSAAAIALCALIVFISWYIDEPLRQYHVVVAIESAGGTVEWTGERFQLPEWMNMMVPRWLLRDVARVDLSRASLSDDLLNQIVGLRNVKVLSLSDCRNFCTSLVPLRQMEGLEELGVSGLAISGSDATAIGGLPNLERLFIVRCGLTDDSVTGICGASKLRELYISNNSISDRGVLDILRCGRLEVLDLRRTNVSDNGILLLVGLPKLEVVDVIGANATEGGIQKASELLPYCEVLGP